MGKAVRRFEDSRVQENKTSPLLRSPCSSVDIGLGRRSPVHQGVVVDKCQILALLERELRLHVGFLHFEHSLDNHLWGGKSASRYSGAGRLSSIYQTVRTFGEA
jgi:hypothetical protein